MITPRQFGAMLRADTAAIETRIDAAIEAAAKFGRVHIDVAIGAWNRDSLELVLGGYRRAGWKADVVPDPRDGDFVRLEVP